MHAPFILYDYVVLFWHICCPIHIWNMAYTENENDDDDDDDDDGDVLTYC